MTLRELWLVRHGESITNAAAREAESAGLELIPSEVRGPDAPLSELGQRQAEALGRWLASLPEQERPDLVLSSPFTRAQQTAAAALRAAGSPQAIRTDERLRDREFGVLTLLTDRGVRARHPEEFARRELLGPFYYRPPGGESWADVILRIRSILVELDAGADERALIVAHDAVVIALLYARLGWTETELLEFTAENPIPNASLTRLSRLDEGPWRLESVGGIRHLSP